MAKKLYFISDLHIGGDGDLDKCQFETELIDFLKMLETETRQTELIIVGDAFGFWEISSPKDEAKLKIIISSHKQLFSQFKKTGAKIKITLIPGNHDHDLSCYNDHVKLLKKYNVNLVQKVAITRTVAGKKIWIEHGSQYDTYNHIKSFGEPHSFPIGYHVSNNIVKNAGRTSDFGKKKWLKDIESVCPTEYIPNWMFSNYFYKEMGTWLRWIILPFLVLFSASAVVYIGSFLEESNLIPLNFFSSEPWLYLGIFGDLLDIVFAVNVSILSFLVLIIIPAFFIIRDVKKTLTKYEVIRHDKFSVLKERAYLDAARKIFSKNKKCKLFIYGHTHVASLKKLEEGVVINTGTWLKNLKRIPSRFRLLPDVYYPSFMLNYFCIYEENKKIIIDYKIIPKKIKSDLTALQHFVIFWRKKKRKKEIPNRTEI